MKRIVWYLFIHINFVVIVVVFGFVVVVSRSATVRNVTRARFQWFDCSRFMSVI